MLSGSDFRPLDSSTGYGSTAFNAVYAINAATYFIATLDLPQQAKITELEFYLRHNATGATNVYLSQATPNTGGEFYYVTNNLATASANIVTLPVPITISDNVSKVDNATFKFLLFWMPSVTGSTDVLFGARVGHTGGLGRFGA